MSLERNGKFAKAVAELPPGEHWAILEFRQITIPGDERSRQAPGHGYPESTETFVSYEFFTDQEQFMQTLVERYRSPFTGETNRRRYVGLKVSEVWVPAVGVSLLQKK